jgi:hypothetical protein
MAYEARPGSGTLFRNETENPKAPAYKGELCLATGEVIRLAGWVKEGAKGKFLSLSIDKPRDGGTGADASRRTEPPRDGPSPFDDDLPPF